MCNSTSILTESGVRNPLQLQLDTFNTLQSLNDLASINLDFPLKKYT